MRIEEESDEPRRISPARLNLVTRGLPLIFFVGAATPLVPSALHFLDRLRHGPIVPPAEAAQAATLSPDQVDIEKPQWPWGKEEPSDLKPGWTRHVFDQYRIDLPSDLRDFGNTFMTDQGSPYQGLTLTIDVIPLKYTPADLKRTAQDLAGYDPYNPITTQELLVDGRRIVHIGRRHPVVEVLDLNKAPELVYYHEDIYSMMANSHLYSLRFLDRNSSSATMLAAVGAINSFTPITPR